MLDQLVFMEPASATRGAALMPTTTIIAAIKTANFDDIIGDIVVKNYH